MEHIQELDTAYADLDSLLTSARAALAEEERQRRLAAQYDQAIQDMDAGTWPKAVETLEAIQCESPESR